MFDHFSSIRIRIKGLGSITDWYAIHTCMQCLVKFDNKHFDSKKWMGFNQNTSQSLLQEDQSTKTLNHVKCWEKQC